jgi:hypothetical protein
MKKAFILFAALMSAQSWAVEVEYRPGGLEFRKVWDRFYLADHEPELDDPLIAAGRKMTLVILDAVAHKDMRLRRYAIGALGQIKDKRALPELERILRDRLEFEYFRGDALHAIYRIDHPKGSALALEFESENDYLKMISTAIKRMEPWLLEDTHEH